LPSALVRPPGFTGIMAKNMCYAAQQVLHERDREMRGGVPSCPVTMTAKQERESQGRTVTYWHKSGQDLWKLKSQQPHLFAWQQQLQGAAPTPQSALPPGFESASPGWLRNPERQVFQEAATQRTLWLDHRTGAHHELAQGDDLSGALSVASGAATAGKPAAAGKPARHVVIMDLHKAAEALKLSLSHLCRPAAMLAVYGSRPGAVPAEVAARAFHEKLLKRLGGFRSSWSDEALQATMAECFAAVAAASAGEQGVAAAVALLLGARLVVAAARGAVCCVAEPRASGPATVLHSVGTAGEEVSTACLQLRRAGTQCVFLLTEAIRDAAMAAAVSQAINGRLRASAVALLQGSPQNPARAAACARLAWAPPGCEEAGPAAKRQRLDAGTEAKVRCRQILLKYVGCRNAVDSVRRRPVRRTLAEAEAAMLGILAEVDAGGDAAFTKQCRAASECSSSMKGGDLAGDVGWLARPVEKPGEKPSREVASRQAVVRAAFELEVGELSDLLVSDDGVHLLQRLA